ncbi:MAG: helix-turn-helix transcriptional regulator [Chloroflexota bacterium]
MATGDASVRLDLRAADLVGCPVVVVTKGAVSSDAMLDQLSPRERQVARLIARGLSNKLLARTLGISLHTVKDHVHNILSKTGLANRAEVAARLGHGA